MNKTNKKPKKTVSDCSHCGGKNTFTTEYGDTGVGYWCDACGHADGDPYHIVEGLDSPEGQRYLERQSDYRYYEDAFQPFGEE